MNTTVDKIKNDNKIKITGNSLSYYLGREPIKYVILINVGNEITEIYSVIGEYKTLDKNLNQTKFSFVDIGEKEIFDYEIKIDEILLSPTNHIKIVPIKENIYIDLSYSEDHSLYIEHLNKENNNLVVIVGVILLLICLICIIYCIKRRKRKTNDLDTKIIESDLQPIED